MNTSTFCHMTAECECAGVGAILGEARVDGWDRGEDSNIEVIKIENCMLSING